MTIVLALILAPLIVLTLCLAIELLAGLAQLRPFAFQAGHPPEAVIVVPAHDEAALIGSTIAALRAAANGIARILVVADNCDDHTAEEVRRTGAEVIERSDPERRGKGFALDFARRHLKASPPQVIVIIDADCRIERASVDRLVSACAATGRPCQATYLLDPAPRAPPTVQISTFAFFIRNVVRQRALQRLIGRVHLLGTGMALPWSAFDREQLATADIVEDLRMGIELAETGRSPLFIEDAQVWSAPETDDNTLIQRRRWEGGFLAHALGSGPKMLMTSFRSGDLRGLWTALDLMIPPLALLLILDFAGLIVATVAARLTGASSWAPAILAASLALAAAALGGAWLRGGSRFVSVGNLARIPLYLIWKLPLYVGLARRGAPKEWLRTRGGGA